MLKKLIKYDMRALYRSVLPVLLVVFILMAAVGALSGTLGRLNGVRDGESLTSLLPAAIGLLVIASAAGLVLSDILIYARYYKNLTACEGYLSFTLPVTGMQHLCSKLVTAIIWFVIKASIAALGIAAASFVAYLISGSSWFFELAGAVTESVLLAVFKCFSIDGNIYAPVWGVLIVLGCLYGLFGILSVFYSLTVGSRLSKSKPAAVMLVLTAVNIAAYIIMSVVRLPFNAINTADLNYFSQFLISVLPSFLTYAAATVYLFVSIESLITAKLNL